MIMKLVFYYLLLVNVLAFILYGVDKFKAKHHRYRIPEMVLLNLSLFGGVYGAVMGMIIFHHKTSKLLFKIVNLLLFIIYTILIYYLVRKYGVII